MLVGDGYKRAGIEARVEPFLYAMDREMTAADLVICRAGAITVSELTAAGVASVLVPVSKLVALALLAGTAQWGSRWAPAGRTRIYRMVEFIGRWSMLDIFVVTLTVALVRFQTLAVITAGPGALAFGCVVILTMIASASPSSSASSRVSAVSG
mgnify:CR=1 FL=1